MKQQSLEGEMPKPLRSNENARRAKAGRARALERVELNQPTTPRIAAGITSMAIKTQDPELRRLIDAAIAERGLL